MFKFLLFPVELKLRQSKETETCRGNTDKQEAVPTGTELQQLNNNSNAKPNVEETVNIITNRLKERRQELGLPDSIKVDFAELFVPLTQI